MSKLDYVIENREKVTEKDLLELREELMKKREKNQPLDNYERTTLNCLENLPIRVEEFKMLLEMGF